MKPCVKCGEPMFQRPDGKWRCRPCGRAYQRARYAIAPEILRERKRLDMARARQDPLRREAMNAARRGNEKYQVASRKYRKKLRDNHFFLARAYKWGRKLDAVDLARLWKKQRGRCVLSGRKLDRTAHLDHIMPISLGGKTEIGNIRWLDPWVNVARQNLTDEEFLARCNQIGEWIGRRILESCRR
jgi:uncharacterized Zn finger protein (UPF0148 family)